MQRISLIQLKFRNIYNVIEFLTYYSNLKFEFVLKLL